MPKSGFRFRQIAPLLGVGVCIAVAGYGARQVLTEINNSAPSPDRVALEEPTIDMGDVETEVVHEIKVRVKNAKGALEARILGGGVG